MVFKKKNAVQDFVIHTEEKTNLEIVTSFKQTKKKKQQKRFCDSNHPTLKAQTLTL